MVTHFLNFLLSDGKFLIADLSVAIGIGEFEETRVLRPIIATMLFHGIAFGIVKLTISIEVSFFHHLSAAFRREIVFGGIPIVILGCRVEHTER